VCAESRPPEQVHTIGAKVDNAPVASDAFSVIVLAQQDGWGAINPDYLLLDSQSTINLFANPNHADNVRPATYLIKFYCNSGVMPTGKVANFGTNKVYINQEGIANVLSLYLLGQKHHITYDSKDRGGVFKVHTTDGIHEFSPTPSCLRVLNLAENPKAAQLLVTAINPPVTEHLHVNTVCDNYDGSTQKTNSTGPGSSSPHAHDWCPL
jgi:hypothetical protein